MSLTGETVPARTARTAAGWALVNQAVPAAGAPEGIGAFPGKRAPCWSGK